MAKNNEEGDGAELGEIGELVAGQAMGMGWNTSMYTFFGPESRNIIIDTEITAATVGPVIGQLLELQDSDPEAPIMIWIFTPGGDIEAALAIYDVMQMLTCPTVTVATGRCMSAGLVLLQGGKVRLATKHCQFMHHTPISEGAAITPEMAKNFMTTYVNYQKMCEDIIRERATISQRVWNKLFRNSTGLFFGTPEAIKWGLVDDVFSGFSLVDAEEAEESEAENAETTEPPAELPTE